MPVFLSYARSNANAMKEIRAGLEVMGRNAGWIALFAARAYVTWISPGEQALPGSLLTCALLLVIHAICWRMRPEFRAELMPPFRFTLAYGAAWSVVLPLVSLSTQPFIYFQF